MVALSFLAFVTVTVAFTVIGSTSPLNVGSGVNVTLPFPSIVNVPFPATVTLSFSVWSAGSTSLRLVTVALFDSVGIVNVGVSSWVTPWIFVVVLSPGVTVSAFTVGVYFASAVSPFSSVACTEIPVAGPVNPGFGMKVTCPFAGLIRYVPWSGTSISFPSTGVLPFGFNNLYPVIRTSGLEIVNVGVPVCVCPCGAEVVAGSPFIVISVTVGVYVVSTFVPFASLIWTLTAVAVPTNVFFGVNVIVLLALSNTYSPSFVVRDVTSLVPSNNVNVLASNSTRSPLAPTWLPLLKFTVLSLSTLFSGVSNRIEEVCFLPCTSLVADASAVGVTGVMIGV